MKSLPQASSVNTTTIPKSPPKVIHNGGEYLSSLPSTLLLGPNHKNLSSSLDDDDQNIERDKDRTAASALDSNDSSKTTKDEDNWQAQEWSASSTPKCSATTTSTKAMIQCHSSPINGWPQRTPMKTDHEQDFASFALFTQSFDTLSETGHYLKDSLERNLSTPPIQKIDLEAETLSQMGDISPIKLDDHRQLPTQLQQPCHSNSSYAVNEGVPVSAYHGSRHYLQSHPRHSYEAYPHHRHHHQTSTSNSIYVLRNAHAAFNDCSYLLPCLENQDICPVHLATHSSVRLYRDEGTVPTSRDVAIAALRVEAAIYALGGYRKPKQPVLSQHDSIFRLKYQYPQKKSASKQFYESCLHQRYVVSANHISWEVEENPPVPGPSDRFNVGDGEHDSIVNLTGPGTNIPQSQGIGSPDSSALSVVPLDSQQKMKYRCKLCGQLKQNHSCPYQQSLQRSIAVMVYPAINAFTASEPGMLTKSLSEMNNFVSYDLKPDSAQTKLQHHVTPESNKSRDKVFSPQSSLSTTESSSMGPFGNNRKKLMYNWYPHQAPTRVSSDKRTIYHQNEYATANRPNKKPFVRSLTLRPEHYRAVTPRSKEKESSYSYPNVPLTFRERKQLSDSLFFLSKEIPSMTIHVASLLRIAREKDEWDLSVAELLTQIIVGVFCREGDHQLDGLRDYLLHLGISC